jgi:hypothetical protein
MLSWLTLQAYLGDRITRMSLSGGMPAMSAFPKVQAQLIQKPGLQRAEPARRPWRETQVTGLSTAASSRE